MAEMLRDGTIRPVLVGMDSAMSGMPTEVLDKLMRLYEPTGIANLHVRREAAQ